jgi:23S rRNA (adenine2030-N6)-methyltransferase
VATQPSFIYAIIRYDARMLSYQHAYHAGNFADCHKHAILCALMDALHLKDSAITWYDFFAGRGAYKLDSIEALKTGEYRYGIASLWRDTTWPTAAQAYQQALQKRNQGDLVSYPGSPVLMQERLRPQDQLVCVEAHPQEFDALSRTLYETPNTALHKRNAWEAVSALLPPKTPRGVAFFDPSYEVKQDYMILADKIIKVFPRWAHGLYVVWYPILPAGQHKEMLNALRKQITRKTLVSEIYVQSDKSKQERIGMIGSGMLIINPPWQFNEITQFEKALGEIGNWLVPALKKDNHARHTLNWLVTE